MFSGSRGTSQHQWKRINGNQWKGPASTEVLIYWQLAKAALWAQNPRSKREKQSGSGSPQLLAVAKVVPGVSGQAPPWAQLT